MEMERQEYNPKFAWTLFQALAKMPSETREVVIPGGWTEQGEKRPDGLGYQIVRRVEVQVRFPPRERDPQTGALHRATAEFWVPSAGVGTRVRLPSGFQVGQVASELARSGEFIPLTRLLYRCCQVAQGEFQPVFRVMGSNAGNP